MPVHFHAGPRRNVTHPAIERDTDPLFPRNTFDANPTKQRGAEQAEVPLPNARTFTYTLTDLGTLSGYRLSTGAAINAQGEVVGLCFNGPGDNLARAFLYRRGQLIDRAPR